jgi:hypothetical protein
MTFLQQQVSDEEQTIANQIATALDSKQQGVRSSGLDPELLKLASELALKVALEVAVAFTSHELFERWKHFISRRDLEKARRDLANQELRTAIQVQPADLIADLAKDLIACGIPAESAAEIIDSSRIRFSALAATHGVQNEADEHGNSNR